MKQTEINKLKKEVAHLFKRATLGTKEAKGAFIFIAKHEGYGKSEIMRTFQGDVDYETLLTDATQRFETDDEYAEKVRELL